MNPAQAGDPLPWLPKAYAEFDGAPAPSDAIARTLTFTEVTES